MNQPRKNSYRYGFKKWADKESIEIRKKMGLLANQPLCAFDLCRFLQIPVLIPQDILKPNSCHLNLLLGDDKDYWSAATIPISENKYVIIHNPKHSAQRQQSNLMHELAHVLCKHQVDPEIKESGLAGFLRHHNLEQENEANWFGGCLQLPREALFWALKKNMTETEISEYFNASLEMVKYRLNITGVKVHLYRLKNYYK